MAMITPLEKKLKKKKSQAGRMRAGGPHQLCCPAPLGPGSPRHRHMQELEPLGPAPRQPWPAPALRRRCHKPSACVTAAKPPSSCRQPAQPRGWLPAPGSAGAAGGERGALPPPLPAGLTGYVCGSERKNPERRLQKGRSVCT